MNFPRLAEPKTTGLGLEENAVLGVFLGISGGTEKRGLFVFVVVFFFKRKCFSTRLILSWFF